MPRKRLCLALITLLTLARPQPIRAEVQAIDAVCLTVSDIDRSVDFYSRALGFEKISDRVVTEGNYDRLVGVFAARARIARMHLGDEVIELVQYLGPQGQPIPVDSKSNDLWFQHMAIVVSDMDRAFAALERVPFQRISDAPQTIPPENQPAAGVKAFKFKDPDGHSLELLYFPPDKGRGKWHRPTDRLFLGIDHSAIAVADTDRSLRFYTEVLGMKVVGGSLNSGPTQEHLDHIFNAKVRVTALRPRSPEGPGIEFLQYLTPPGGRPFPLSQNSNDLIHVHLDLVVGNLRDDVGKLEKAGAQFVSPDVIEVNRMSFKRGTMVRDPDGHGLLLIEK